MLKAQEAQNIVAINDLMPDLDLTASYGITGNSPHFHQSLDLSFNKPATSSAVMVKLTFPLSPVKINAVKRAYRNSSRASRLNYDRMKFQHDQQWDDLMVRLEENLKLLQLLKENLEVQRCKFENAELEYARGLSTFFVVTNAQNDYQSSKIAILQTFDTLLNILLNLGMYGGGK
jgi:outer membrane protein TolC